MPAHKNIGIGVMAFCPTPKQPKQPKSKWLEQLINGVAECSNMTREEVAECVMEVVENERE